MKLAQQILFITAALVFSTFVTTAQAPVQTDPAKVGVVNSNTFASAPNGITRYINAMKTLDNEFRARREEIQQLVARFDELQKVPAGATAPQIEARREQAETLQISITRKQEDARAAYTRRFSQLTDPLQKSIIEALSVYAKARGIDVLIDVSKFPEGVLLVNQNVDLTAGFVRDFNSKNP